MHLVVLFIFLSTPSARRATRTIWVCLPRSRISIHALREEGDIQQQRMKASRTISIHALREEGDSAAAGSRGCSRQISIHALREEGDLPLILPLKSKHDFYPRPPRGGRRALHTRLRCAGTISIHALREEGDQDASGGFSFQCNFYPRPPRGGRRGPSRYPAGIMRISIHALREEGDDLCRWHS